MQLQFTRDLGPRFAKGDIRDYGRDTWRQIANSAGLELDDFTVDPEVAVQGNKMPVHARVAAKAKQPSAATATARRVVTRRKV